MPVIEVTMVEGRSKEKKAALISELTNAAVSAIGAPIESVRVILREIPPEHFGVAGKAKERK
ncbi:MAG: 2-hydroxymuconate tautomerase family protein [Kordiimonadaceae bacterium]|nr:2-hydroxymuconate tautomerase family protein [Kordiimonadaceae bacterium]MBV1901078.1 2-hydroxymuconate tautomerase family protein [Kordiimonadaceae bacterium]